jgi:hypothetical protein
MMKPALTPDPVIVGAINALRSAFCLPPASAHSADLVLPTPASNKFRLGALTNNFVVPGAAVPPPQTIPDWSSIPSRRAIPFKLLAQSFKEAAANPDTSGAPTELLKSMFDLFIESSVEKLR